MGWFWASSQEGSSKPAKCPVDHKSMAGCPVDHTPAPTGCPVNHDSLKQQATQVSSQPQVSGCPVDHETRSKFSWFNKPSGPDANNNNINPLNNMPDLSSIRAPGQTLDLPTERTLSTIPRGSKSEEGVWEYPSPQQMYNAMLRKGGGEIPEDAVESMVDVHNFLNEGAWYEILKWEEPYTKETKTEPRLLKFTGRPNDTSPRAMMLQILGKIYPSKFGMPPPFDRHDWTVLRAQKDGQWEKVRYVIDYYSADDDDNNDDNPGFILDVRPALDTVSSAVDRFNFWSGSVVQKALGLEQPYK